MAQRINCEVPLKLSHSTARMRIFQDLAYSVRSVKISYHEKLDCDDIYSLTYMLTLSEDFLRWRV